MAPSMGSVCLLAFIIVALNSVTAQSAQSNTGTANQDQNRSDNCSLPIVNGPCRAHFTRFGFSPRQNKCVRFIYGGCRGNGNNFLTRRECNQKCLQETDVCKLPAVRGRCRAYFTRYAYNPSTLQCESFVYGGCGSNGNNFMTLAECQEQCSQATNNN